MSINMDPSSYITENKYEIECHNSRKSNGELPTIYIGKKCSIGKNCTFILSHHRMDLFTTSSASNNIFPHQQGNNSSFSKGDIIIKNDVWIGTKCIILDGITIHNGAVVGAGSVVTKSVPPYAVVCGNPAKIVKYRFSKEIIDEIEELNFWDLPIHDISNFDIHTENIKEFIEKVKEFKKKKETTVV